MMTATTLGPMHVMAIVSCRGLRVPGIQASLPSARAWDGAVFIVACGVGRVASVALSRGESGRGGRRDDHKG